MAECRHCLGVEKEIIEDDSLTGWHYGKNPCPYCEGRKFDKGKDRWDLLPMREVEDIVKVITYGANKYDDNNWMKVDSERYFAATLRHLSAFRQNESIDPESGLPHLAHAACCILFMAWHDTEGKTVPPIAPQKSTTQIAIDETWRQTINDVAKRMGGSLVHMEDELSIACCPFCNQLICGEGCTGYPRQRYLKGEL